MKEDGSKKERFRSPLRSNNRGRKSICSIEHFVMNFFRFDYVTMCGSSTNDDDNITSAPKSDKYFGRVVHWLDERHLGATELEKYRMIGDVETDNLLELIMQSKKKKSNTEEESLPFQTTKESIDKNISTSFRFLDVVDTCTKLYNEHKQKQYQLQKNVNLHDSDSSKLSGVNKTELAMIQFYDHHYNNIPDWVDWDQVQRGIDVFITYSPAMSLALYYLSLVPGFSIPKIAKVLEQTKYLAPPSTTKQIQQRLFDTGGFVISCMVHDTNTTNKDSDAVENILSASSLRPGGMGWQMALRVRVLHAKIRRMLLMSEKYSWDVNEFGIPINQEDMAATLLAFSTNALSGIEFITNKPLSTESQLDYLALWRYIGWLLGVSTNPDEKGNLPLDPCGPGFKTVRSGAGTAFDKITRVRSINPEDTLIHSRTMLESMVIHLMHPNELSSKISNHLLCFGRRPIISSSSSNSSEDDKSKNVTHMPFGYLYRSFMCRRYIGCELADALRIPRPCFWSMKHILAYQLTTTILLILRVYTLLTMHSAWFRHRAHKRHLRQQNKFYLLWMKENSERMGSLARKSMSYYHNSDKKKATVTSLQEDRPRESSSICPFSLVMPATGSDTTSLNFKKDKLL